jgi:uncharacterized ubiquitin-like protein YukD
MSAKRLTVIRKNEGIISFPVTSFSNRDILVDHEEPVALFPTVSTHGLEGLKVHVTVDVTVVDVAQVQTILLKQHQQVEVVSDQVFGDLGVRLTQVERIHVKVSTHAKVLAHHRLFLTSYVIEDHDAELTHLAGW